jgi:ABC-type glycerol-3-phosphate transport system substrate-binding protein
VKAVARRKRTSETWEKTSLRFSMANVLRTAETLRAKKSFENKHGLTTSYDLWSETENWRRQKFRSHTKNYDCFMTTADLMNLFVDTEQIEPLDEYIAHISDPQQLAKEDFIDEFKNMLSYHGSYYMLPIYCESTFFMYRKDLYEKYRLQEPKTTEDVWHNAKTIQEGEHGEIYGAITRGKSTLADNVYTWTPVLRAFGGNYFKDFPHDLSVVLDSPEAIESVRYYADLLQKFGPKNSSELTWEEMMPILWEGKVAQAWESTTVFGGLYKNPNCKYADQWKACDTPVASGQTAEKTKPGNLFVCSYAINADTSDKKKKAAFKWIEWATGKKTFRKMADEAPHLFRASSPRKSTLQLSTYSKENDIWIAPFIRSIQKYGDANATPKMKEWPAIGQIAGFYLEQTIAGRVSAQNACRRMQEEITHIVKNSGYPPYGNTRLI